MAWLDHSISSNQLKSNLVNWKLKELNICLCIDESYTPLVCKRSLTLCKWAYARCHYDYNTKHPASSTKDQFQIQRRKMSTSFARGADSVSQKINIWPLAESKGKHFKCSTKTFKIFEKKFKKRLAWSAPAWCLIKIKFFNKNCSIFCHEPEKTWQNIINEDQRTAGWQNWLLNQHQTSFSKSRSGEESYIFYPLQKPRLC